MRTINLTEAEIEIIKKALQFVHDRKYDIIEQNRLIMDDVARDVILKNAAKYYDTRDVFDGSRDVKIN